MAREDADRQVWRILADTVVQAGRLFSETTARVDALQAGARHEQAEGHRPPAVEQPVNRPPNQPCWLKRIWRHWRVPGPKGKRECQRLVELIIFFGGALAGLILFGELARDSFAESTAWLRVAFVTAVIAAATLLGLARLSVQWFITQCERGRVANPENGAPQKPFRLYELATVTIGIAGFILLFATVWAAVAPAHPREVAVIEGTTTVPHRQSDTQRPSEPRGGHRTVDRTSHFIRPPSPAPSPVQLRP